MIDRQDVITVRKKRKNAQTFMEYVLLLSVVAGVYLAMTPLLRRGIQSMVRSVADQIGNQVNADDGHSEDQRTLYTTTKTEGRKDKTLLEWQGNITEQYGDSTQYRMDSKALLTFQDFVNEME